MKALPAFLMLFPILLAGCAPTKNWSQQRQEEAAKVEAYTEQAAANAVIAEFTIYPHHFVNGAAILNDLGKRDLAIMADHLKLVPGTLNLRRRDAPEPLYMQRQEAVADFLRQHDVNMANVTITDNMPGGEGMASERVIAITKEKGASKNVPSPLQQLMQMNEGGRTNASSAK